MKINYLNQILLNWYYRKYIQHQNEINHLLHSGEFFKLSNEFQEKMISRLKFLYDRIAGIMKKNKVKLSEALMDLSNSFTNAREINPVHLGLAVGRINDNAYFDTDEEKEDETII